MGFQDVDMEGDSPGIIIKMQSQIEDMSSEGTLIEETKVKTRFFKSCIFMHSGRGEIWWLIVWLNMD
ncbi:hypothetical protein CRYUN_Cryun08bG0081400 [Craigia yunnanensis]